MARSRPESAGTVTRLRAFLSTRTGRVLSRLVAASVALLLLGLVVRQARASVEKMPTYRLRPEDVAFEGLPESADAGVRAGLAEFLPAVWPRRGALTTFSPGLEPRLRDALAHHPMVREVVDVEVRFPREVRARVAVRMPLAAFRTRLGAADGHVVLADVPVDATGVVLDPSTYSGFVATHDVVRVLGVRAACPAVGSPWLDSDEQVEEALAAARVANRLNAERASGRVPRVVAVDVGAFPAPPARRALGEVLLVLEDERIVQWGRTERDLAGAPHEDGYAAKRDRLVDLLALPELRGKRELDVRFPSAPVPFGR